MNNKTEKLLVHEGISIKEAMRQMGRAGEKVVFVVDQENRLLGSLTDGDIRRWYLKEGDLMAEIDGIYNKDPIFVADPYDSEHVKTLMLQKKINWIPLVREDGVISEVLLWENIFGKDMEIHYREKIDIPVVIMAGGKGTRLDPFTKILPKPLIPIGDKSIIEIIMDKFIQHGVDHFHISTNHKSKLMKAYFEELNILTRVSFIEEDKPLGTAGSLRLIRDEIEDAVFVSNCDIIVDTNYHDIVEFHRKSDYDMTLIGSFRHFVIPYGICSMENGGTLGNIEEKPEYDFLVNTGMYVINKSALDLIPPDQFFNITDLVCSIKDNGGQVGVFPIDEKSWIDVGQWEEYHKALRHLGVGV